MELGHFDKYSSTTQERRALLLEKLKRCILNEKSIDGRNLDNFLKTRELFSSFEKGQGRSPLLPSSYTTIVTRACRILLLTKFTIMKLKTDVFSVSTIFF